MYIYAYMYACMHIYIVLCWHILILLCVYIYSVFQIYHSKFQNRSNTTHNINEHLAIFIFFLILYLYMCYVVHIYRNKHTRTYINIPNCMRIYSLYLCPDHYLCI